MDYVEHDSDSVRYTVTTDMIVAVTYSPDTSGDYHRTTDCGGYAILENNNGETVASIHNYD